MMHRATAASPHEMVAASPPATVDFLELFRRECGYVANTLRRLGVRDSDVEDVTQETFITVHRQLASYDPSRPLRPWLFGIAFRTAANYRRQAHHQRERFDLDQIDSAIDDAPGPEEHLSEQASQSLVLRALETLDLDRRAVLVMHDLDGHTVPEISAALGVPLATAYSRLRLAREEFASAVHRLRIKGGLR